MKKLYETLYVTAVAISFLVVVGFWFGVGLFLGMEATSRF